MNESQQCWTFFSLSHKILDSPGQRKYVCTRRIVYAIQQRSISKLMGPEASVRTVSFVWFFANDSDLARIKWISDVLYCFDPISTDAGGFDAANACMCVKRRME